jgi:hypothetical protein
VVGEASSVTSGMALIVTGAAQINATATQLGPGPSRQT